MPGFEALRDYPRRFYNDIASGKSDPKNIKVVVANFSFSDEEISNLPSHWVNPEYVYTKYLDNHATHEISQSTPVPKYGSLKSDLSRLALHVDQETSSLSNKVNATDKLKEISAEDEYLLGGSLCKSLTSWLDEVEPFTDENNENEQLRINKIRSLLSIEKQNENALNYCSQRLPLFIFYNNYLRVRPIIHLGNLAKRQAFETLDDKQYDYGNLCLLKMLGFDVNELSRLGNVENQNPNTAEALNMFRKQLDERRYALNAAEVQLSEVVASTWKPNTSLGEASQLRIDIDGQLLTVSVVDELGVTIELDQRSEGFQWLVSFFIVLFAETENNNLDAILLLDEPGVSLHGLRQRQFRDTISKLSEKNQTIFTTHSPYMVGSDELDKVRVVEMECRREGTKIRTTSNKNDDDLIMPLTDTPLS